MTNETLSRKVNAFISKQRKAIPDKYNQVRLLDYLTDPDVRLMVSITTRSDGKTYNYLLMLVRLALKFPEFKFLLIARHFTLRNDYMDTLHTIIQEQLNVSKDAIYFEINARYITLYLNKTPICLITDLNAATDLKYSSQVLKNFRLIVYDEFVALKGDYLPDEVNQLKTIYESVARPSVAPQLLETPKILLMGNPVNWDSPLMSFFNMYSVLEKQSMNTVEKHGNMAFERFKNENSLDSIDTDLFGDSNASYTGEFKVNRDLIATSHDKTTCLNRLVIKLSNEHYLIVHYENRDHFYLEITLSFQPKVDFSQTLEDMSNGVTYLDDHAYHDSYIRRHQRGKIIYANSYTISQFDLHPELQALSITSLINKANKTPIEPTYKEAETKIKLDKYAALKQRLFEEYLF